ncbi:MAG: hypothetical protein GDA43_09895 [Hormoscilla sp. SP5CHS1]|nr:hypothetical protein [Hormoscilla sp. SP5CHS1]
MMLEEKALLEIIQRRLPPAEQTRLEELDDKNEWGELSEAEYNELLAYVERIEHQNVERVAALIELAKIINADLATLMSDRDKRMFPSISTFGQNKCCLLASPIGDGW